MSESYRLNTKNLDEDDPVEELLLRILYSLSSIERRIRALEEFTGIGEQE